MANLILPKYYRQQKPPLGSVIDWSNPLSKDLISCWLMNEGLGNVVNDTTQRYKGINNGARWISSVKGLGLSFDGNTSTYIYLPDFITDWSKFTIVANINPTNFSIYRGIISFASTFPNPFDLYLLEGSGDIQFYYGNGEGGGGYGFGFVKCSAPPTGKFTQLVCVCNGGLVVNSRIYFNGIRQTLTSTQDFTGTWSNNSQVGYIGTRGDNVTSFLGSITYIYIYNRALSPSEIQSLYIAPYQMIKARNRILPITEEPPVTTSGTPYGFLSLNTGYW